MHENGIIWVLLPFANRINTFCLFAFAVCQRSVYMNSFTSGTAQFLLKGTDTNLGAGTVASVVITGLVVVFIGLILLILLCMLYGAIFKKINESKAEKAAVKEATRVSQKSEQKKPEPTPAPAIENGIGDETVAVIAAAITAMGAASGKKLALKSISTAKPQRNAWASAGIAENTRPF